ncbi:UAP56-interacting factor [Saguinus oedipus]|uniref:UAP56-interacting factor n=1 Tax=Saguinus oedipus TaxID=9490 RepID=A0ABQ9TZN7_SAGOE|nr:UAP56-interacting factor [Saguinus oedipus]
MFFIGFGKTSLNRRGRVMPGKRRPSGVITGLAARKTTGIRKGVSPMNRPPLSSGPVEHRTTARRCSNKENPSNTNYRNYHVPQPRRN